MLLGDAGVSTGTRVVVFVCRAGLVAVVGFVMVFIANGEDLVNAGIFGVSSSEIVPVFPPGWLLAAYIPVALVGRRDSWPESIAFAPIGALVQVLLTWSGWGSLVRPEAGAVALTVMLSAGAVAFAGVASHLLWRLMERRANRIVLVAAFGIAGSGIVIAVGSGTWGAAAVWAMVVIVVILARWGRRAYRDRDPELAEP